MTDALTLYVDANYESPWALCAFVALEEKKLTYTLATKSLSKKETFAPGYEARTQRVPALQRGNFWLAESVAIAEYLAESFPFPDHPRIFPENLEQRATCREVQHWLRTDLMPLRQERPTTTLWFEQRLVKLSDAAKESGKRLTDVASTLIKPGQTTLFESWCIADVDLALALQRLHHNGDSIPEHLVAYAKANWERPSVKKWHALPRERRPV
ncbi:MAG: glutathione transferase [Archangium sp.]|nr:glutathione transferase [Archangium sp.]